MLHRYCIECGERTDQILVTLALFSRSPEVIYILLRPKSTAGRLVHLTTLFSWASLNKQAVNQYLVHILSLVTDNNPS